GVPVRCQILGFLDVQNRSAIDRKTVDAWQAEGVIEYLGATDDVRPTIAAADCVVLPSYREGTPRSLLEASAMGRPIITTDAPGCRDVVDDGASGYLCALRDVASLADAMRRFAMLSPEQRATMGAEGRRKMERQFDEQIVIKAYLDWLERHCLIEPAASATTMMPKSTQ
ncbi:MAG: glycosyltransferase, partial [Burkholderiaceae bacterium]|nr:glycosyltransferase [Burkholderiaceae bacterium]